MQKCEACGYESRQTKLRIVRNSSSGTPMVVDSCRKCNWFLFENQWHKEKVLKVWKNA
jgi:hypothetical protein